MANELQLSKAAGTLKNVADKFANISPTLVPVKDRSKGLIYKFDLWNACDCTDNDKLQKCKDKLDKCVNEANGRLTVKNHHFEVLYEDRISGSIGCFPDGDGSIVATGLVNDGAPDYGYMQEGAYQQYLVIKSQNYKTLQNFVKEASIICDDTITVNEAFDQLVAINEEDGNFITDGWTKIKNFFNKMWLKFNEFISRTINSDKNYLDKYKNIILGKEWTLGDKVKCEANYFDGIKYISQYAAYLPTASDLNGFGNEDTPENRKNVNKKILPAYGAHTTIDFADYCKSYFKGDSGATNKEFALDGSKMSDMFNFCYNYEGTRKHIEKEKANMEKSIVVFENKIKEIQNLKKSGEGNKNNTESGDDQKNSDPNKINEMNQAKKEFNAAKANYDKVKNNTNDPNYNKYKQDAEAALEKYKKFNNIKGYQELQLESVIYTNLGYPINEAISKDSDGGTNAPNVNASGVKAAGNFGNASAGGTMARGHQSTNTDNEALAASNADENALKAQFNMYSSGCTTVFGSILTAAQTIHSDFMKAMKWHVQSILGNKDATNTTVQNPTNNTATKFDEEKLKTEIGENGEKADSVITTMNQKKIDLDKLSKDPDSEDKAKKLQVIYNDLNNYAGKGENGVPSYHVDNIQTANTIIDQLINRAEAAKPKANNQTP